MEDFLEIAGKKIKNRLFVGTGKFSSYPLMKEALEKAQVNVVTVALRRVDSDSKTDNILDYIPEDCILMTNTSGARNADEAVRIARLAKAGGCGNWIKIEIITDNKYLLPDNIETLRATEILAKEGFVKGVSKKGKGLQKNIEIELIYEDKNNTIPKINQLKRISKPGQREYVRAKDIRTVLGGRGTNIFSTSKGLMAGKEAKKKGLGGELLCEIW